MLLGDSIATNMMMMGYAYQKGLLPLSAKAIEQAIEVTRRCDQDEHPGVPARASGGG